MEPGTPGVSAWPLCDRAAPAYTADQPCLDGRDCPLDALCVGSDTGNARCMATCFPDACGEATCGAAGECIRLQDRSGAPLQGDWNGDGLAEVIGACLPVPEAEAPAWAPCTSGQRCEPGNLCLALRAGAPGLCMPVCTAFCEAYQGFLPACLQAGEGLSVCGILCDPADGPVACPGSLSCTVIGIGGALCSP
jgi:hypothetical protein